MAIGVKFTGKKHHVGELVRKRRKLELPREVQGFLLTGIAEHEAEKTQMVSKLVRNGVLRGVFMQSPKNPKYWGIYMG